METTITKEQAMQWLMAAKRKKHDTLEEMKKYVSEEFERRTGERPTYIEAL